MIVYAGRLALVTGASSGIGAAFAEALAARGASVVLVARSEPKLHALADRLRRTHPVQVKVVAVDLATDDGPDLVAEAVRRDGLDVDVLVNNAGFGTYGPYDETDGARLDQEVRLNVVAVERLTRLFLPAMVERGSGVIVHTSSTTGFQAVPYMAMYGATKAFVLSYSVALWAEYRRRGVRVLALCPGPTDTNFFRVLGVRMNAGGRLRTTDEVLATAFRALDRNQPYVIDGRLNYLTSNLSRFMPRSVVARITERVIRPPLPPVPPLPDLPTPAHGQDEAA